MTSLKCENVGCVTKTPQLPGKCIICQSNWTLQYRIANRKKLWMKFVAWNSQESGGQGKSIAPSEKHSLTSDAQQLAKLIEACVDSGSMQPESFRKSIRSWQPDSVVHHFQKNFGWRIWLPDLEYLDFSRFCNLWRTHTIGHCRYDSCIGIWLVFLWKQKFARENVIIFSVNAVAVLLDHWVSTKHSWQFQYSYFTYVCGYLFDEQWPTLLKSN